MPHAVYFAIGKKHNARDSNVEPTNRTDAEDTRIHNGSSRSKSKKEKTNEKLCTAYYRFVWIGEARLSECAFRNSLGLKLKWQRPIGHRSLRMVTRMGRITTTTNHSIRNDETFVRQRQQKQQVNHLPSTKHHTIIDRTFNHTFEAYSIPSATSWHLVYSVGQATSTSTWNMYWYNGQGATQSDCNLKNVEETSTRKKWWFRDIHVSFR